MSTITRDDRLGIYNAISSTDFFENLCSQGMLISFLNSIWELRALPSTDSRFVDLMGDIQQHMINNNDWTFEILFGKGARVRPSTAGGSRPAIFFSI